MKEKFRDRETVRMEKTEPAEMMAPEEREEPMKPADREEPADWEGPKWQDTPMAPDNRPAGGTDRRNQRRRWTVMTASILAAPLSFLVMTAAILLLKFNIFATREMTAEYLRNGGNWGWVTGLEEKTDWKKLAAELSSAWSKTGYHMINQWLWVAVVAGLALFLLCCILAVWKSGQKTDDGEIFLCRFDRMWTEVQVFLAVCAGCLTVPAVQLTSMWVIQSGLTASMLKTVFRPADGPLRSENIRVLVDLIRHSGFYGTGNNDNLLWWVEALGSFLLLAAAVWFCAAVVLSIARTLKARSFWKYTLIGSICIGIRNVLTDGNHFRRNIIIMSLAGCFLPAVLGSITDGVLGMGAPGGFPGAWLGSILLALVVGYFLPRWMRRYEEIRKGAERIADGETSYRIPVSGEVSGDGGFSAGRSDLEQLAYSINRITEAQDLAVQREVRSQRLRTDLISNVSHDLKTPLTSMVTYIDLLKTEGLDSPEAPEYLRILDEKTARLRQLTLDLFDAAKASSGVIPMEFTDLDMETIANQAVAEMADRLRNADVDLVVTTKNDGLNDRPLVRADGRYLWRVIENLLSNVSKYAMPGTRCYLDIIPQRDRGTVRLEMKNISREQLNIDPEELMERFTRGDTSRNTEGSGLGLSIARDLTKMMKGIFRISIDGDLFKATVELPASNDK